MEEPSSSFFTWRKLMDKYNDKAFAISIVIAAAIVTIIIVGLNFIR